MTGVLETVMHHIKRLSAVSLPIHLLLLILFLFSSSYSQVGNYASHTVSDRSVLITTSTGGKIRITPYGEYMVRIQTIRSNEEFFDDDHYEMVERHDWDGELTVADETSSLVLSTGATDGISVTVTKNPLHLSFSHKNDTEPLLEEDGGVSWSGNTITESFAATTNEHFVGLGHVKYGRIDKLDRRGTSLKVSTGNEGACIVPFYLSSRGYGVFLNTTFTHTITLDKSNVYSLQIDDEGYGGRMDYFFIGGPKLTQVLDRYTQLTGRARMPQRSIFGLHLSDKSDPNNNGEQWWKNTINSHRNAGFAFDHQVNDNAWRASNEATSGQKNSWFDWRKDRFPDPAEYKRWCDQNGITVTLDLNRPGIPLNPSWNNSLSIPGVNDCPDFTNPAARKWIWDLFYDHAFNPSLGYPGDAIWLDEFDYPDHAHSTTLSSGKKWAEEAINYHFDLLKACVKEGWDEAIGESKRSYFWSRGITAGAQRFGFYWSGDINGNWNDMKYQVKAMQSAGMSGFPYFNHDAGGHVNLSNNGDNSYRQWDMGFGSFTPIWKPHGPSHQRWPAKRNSTCQNTARTYITTRYEMIPYIYSIAHQAYATGMPMARPMFLEDQNNETAWQKEMQYYWGSEMLVAPNGSDGNNNVSIWLPEGDWYDFWNDRKYTGNQTINYNAPTGTQPVLAKAGAIIPKAPYALSTFFIAKDTLVVHVYAGADGSFKLYEDDGVTEKYRTKDEFRTTSLKYTDTDNAFGVDVAKGTYSDAPDSRCWKIVYHGLSSSTDLFLDEDKIGSYNRVQDIPASGNGAVWDGTGKLMTVRLSALPVNKGFTVSSVPTTGVSRRVAAVPIAERIRIMPDRITLTVHGAEKPVVSIHRLNGALVHRCTEPDRQTGSVQEFSLRRLSLSNGTYIVRIRMNDVQLIRQFVVR